MDTMSYSAFRKNLSATLHEVNENHTPVLITRKNGSSAVVMGLEDYNSWLVKKLFIRQ